MMPGRATKRIRSGPIAALVLFAVLVLYPLSTGPAFWLVRRGHISASSWVFVYQPVVWLPDDGLALRAVEWYLRFFVYIR